MRLFSSSFITLYWMICLNRAKKRLQNAIHSLPSLSSLHFLSFSVQTSTTRNIIFIINSNLQRIQSIVPPNRIYFLLWLQVIIYNNNELIWWQYQQKTASSHHTRKNQLCGDCFPRNSIEKGRLVHPGSGLDPSCPHYPSHYRHGHFITTSYGCKLLLFLALP